MAVNQDIENQRFRKQLEEEARAEKEKWQQLVDEMDKQKRENARLSKIEIDRLRKQIWEDGSDLKKQKMMEAEAEARRLKRFAEQDAEIYKGQLKEKIDEEVDILRAKA